MQPGSMKDNYESIIFLKRERLAFPKVLLVPYRPEHVERYHAWMQDPDLLTATASEPLTLDEEYEMQESWHDDPHKCTCILLSVARLCLTFPELSTVLVDHDDDRRWNEWLSRHPNFLSQSLDAMIGDVNLFLSEYNTTDDDGASSLRQAEVDVMIAEPAARRQGCAREACGAMLCYGATQLGVSRYYCKIHADNTASRTLFENKLHFRQCNYAECFQEYEYECVAESPAAMVKILQDTRRRWSAEDGAEEEVDNGGATKDDDETTTASWIRILPCPLQTSTALSSFSS